MNACSIPIQTVIGISNCWFGFLHWFSVADNNATPDNSLADSDPFRFSPYLLVHGININFNNKIDFVTNYLDNGSRNSAMNITAATIHAK